MSATPEGITSEKLTALAWPFVTALTAIPLVATISIGGLKMLGQLTSMRKFLENLPQHIEHIEALSTRIETTRQSISTSMAQINSAAGVIDQSVGQMVDVQARLKFGDNSSTATNTTKETSDAVKSFWNHQDKMKSIFERAASAYEAQNTEGVRRVRGWILDASVDQLHQSGLLDNAEAAYIKCVLEVDRETRVRGRENLTTSHIDYMDRMAAKLPTKTGT